MRVVRIIHNKIISWARLDRNRLLLFDKEPWLGANLTGEIITFEEKNIMAPCIPGKIIGVAVNYPGITGLNSDIDEPLVFLKSMNTIIGPNSSIINPFNESSIWGECELAVVIGKTLNKASAEEAKTAIFGYTIANDVTVENTGGRDHHLARSKAADTLCPVGPWIDTEFQPKEHEIEGWHNNTLLRQGKLSDRLYREPELLVWLSSWIRLEPGDLVLTGAPARVRDRIYLEEGDTFTCRIEGLGELKNICRTRKRS